MTESVSAVTAGQMCEFGKNKMDVSKKIIRNLQPARPLRRLNENQMAQSFCKIKPFDKTAEKPDVKVQQFYEILRSTSLQPPKKDRICYTREFLIQMADCPVSKMKPAFLPNHPVVLDTIRSSEAWTTNQYYSK